ncbi:MAG: hypothetical protein J6386_21885 [Candidatus Synoicihabitans palmerolidicus]|nr:hypothetical protein [Candidatus Synoicihabitans palmerolidicus]
METHSQRAREVAVGIVVPEKTSRHRSRWRIMVRGVLIWATAIAAAGYLTLTTA